MGFIAPRVVRETRYVEESCRIDGQAPRQPQQLERLLAFLELKVGVEEFQRLWPTTIHLDRPDPRHDVAHIEGLVQELHGLLELFRAQPPNALAPVPVGRRADLAQSNEREKWLALIRAEMARRHVDRVREPLEGWRASLRQIILSGNAHPCLQRMAEAVEDRDGEKWRIAWETRERLKVEKDRFRRYAELISKLDQAHPGLGELLRSSQGRPEWKDRLLQLGEAWAWAAARAWLRKATNPERCERLDKEKHRLQGKIEKKLEELAALKAWQAFSPG